MVKLIDTSLGSMLVSLYNKRKIPVSFWVINNEEDLQKAVKRGAYSIMTDRPKEILELIKKS